jgi:hypothetical protein
MGPAFAATTTFENQGLAADSFINNAGPGGEFIVDGHALNNDYNAEFDVWSGWALSTMTDNVTPGFTNQHSAIPGSGSAGSQTYAVAFTFSFTADPLHPDDSIVDLAPGTSPLAVDVTNTTYAYYAMRDGDAFSKKFGPGDYFLLDVRGFDAAGGSGNLVGTVEFYLADFIHSPGSIVDTWQTVDLAPLAGAKSLRFGLRSSDNGAFGMNTPAFLAIDNLQVLLVPEPGGLALAVAAILAILCCRKPFARRIDSCVSSLSRRRSFFFP